MELRQLRYAVTLARELHFGRAAAREHVAQSAFSQQIQRLERELQVRLFDRSTHHVRLTDAGRVLTDGARRLLVDLDDLVAQTRAAAGEGAVAPLRLGCVGYAQWWPEVRAALAAFAAQAPEVDVRTTYGTVLDLVAGVREGTLDAVVVNGQVPDETLDSVGLARMPVEVLLPAGHRLAGRAEIAVADLAGERLILWPRQVNPVVFDDTLRFFDRHEVPVTVVEVSQIHQAWLGAVAAGEGFALIAAANQLGHDGVVRRRFAGESPVLDLRLVWRRAECSAAVAELAQAVRRSRDATALIA